jgi:hypothetical protein
MKNFLPCAVASLAVLLSSPAAAEVIVYKGTVKATSTGQSRTAKMTFKAFFVVDHDHDTADVAQLLYASAGGMKYYTTGLITNQHIVEVTGAGLKRCSALTRPPNECDISNGATGEAVFLQGANSTLTIGMNTTISFPKTFSAAFQGYYDDFGQPHLISQTLALSFDKTRTITSNSAGDTHESALAKLIAYVESLGYTAAPTEASTAVEAAIHRALLLQPEGTAPSQPAE